MGLKDLFTKKPDRFRQLLAEQASKTLEGVHLLEQYVRAPGPDIVAALTRTEKEADELRRILIDELNQTFATPFDREDIFSLSRVIDDIIDYAHTSVDEMALFQVEPNADIVNIVKLLADAATEIHLAVLRLGDHPGVAIEHAKRAKSVENRVEDLYRQALAHLFENVKTIEDVTRVLKLREILRHLSNSADRGDEAANLISDIVVKGT
jgi:predicted phosphate transport protein (TIGR00153 family)